MRNRLAMLAVIGVLAAVAIYVTARRLSGLTVFPLTSKGTDDGGTGPTPNDNNAVPGLAPSSTTGASPLDHQSQTTPDATFPQAPVVDPVVSHGQTDYDRTANAQLVAAIGSGAYRDPVPVDPSPIGGIDTGVYRGGAPAFDDGTLRAS